MTVDEREAVEQVDATEVVVVRPLILVSSRDGVAEPAGVGNRSAGWRSVLRAAERAGWTARTTYALSWMADQHYLNGNVAKRAHHVHSVALRATRGSERAVAVWRGESAMPEPPETGWSWRFALRSGMLGTINKATFVDSLA